MTCPNCDFDGLRPVRDHGNGKRQYTCYRCGYRFETVEMLVSTAQHQAFQATLFKVLAKETG